MPASVGVHGKQNCSRRRTRHGGFSQDGDEPTPWNRNGRFRRRVDSWRVPRFVPRGLVWLSIRRAGGRSVPRFQTRANRKGKLRTGGLPVALVAKGSAPGRSQRLRDRSEEHTSELQSPDHLVCRLLLEKKKIH